MSSRIYTDTRRTVGVVFFAGTSMIVSGGPLFAQERVQQVQERVVRSAADAVEGDELRAHSELGNAYTIVEALHSNWLVERSRGLRSYRSG
ncbi:MAG: hypothetical protein ABI852_09260, partial [Gemmatimonadaceae bacterium]